MSRRHLSIEEEAKTDVSHAARWYEEQREGLGFEFLAQLDEMFERIAENPLQFPEIEEGARRALLPRFPYAVYFVVAEAEVAIRAVLHLHRSPETWRSRISGRP